MQRIPRSLVRLCRLLPAATLAVFLWMLAIEASPQLHEWIHPDADSGHHECAVTDMSSGGLGDGLIAQPFAVSSILPHQFWCVAEFVPRWIASLFLTNCVLEHAPPSVS
jgi:hypothetical protein